MKGIKNKRIIALVLTIAVVFSITLEAKNVKAADMVGKTREQVAAWISQEMKRRGEKVDEELLNAIKAGKRISDIKRISSKNREAVLLVYHWGIMGGSSNGAYSKSRSFQGDKKVTEKEWKEIKKRIENPKKRLKLSPDGQLCRTTKLPQNSKKFSYILASYPNSYYEGTFDYEWYEEKQKEGEDYVNPVNINKSKFKNWKTSYPFTEIRTKYEKLWKQCIVQNLETRLNVDYRTISKDYEWLNNLRNTYYLYDDWEQDLRKTKEIEEYIEKVKKNKVIIKGIVDVDSSTLYRSLTGYFMRAHIKFKIVSAKEIPKNQTEIIFGEHVYFKGLKKGVWKEAIVDIGLASANFYSDGGDFAIFTDNLIDSLKK